jgi:ribosomal-protein-alanine N-acetyltransferase
MRAFAGARNAVTLVAEGSGGEVAGFVIMQLERRSGAVRGYVVTLDVSPEGRRNGLAARMMQEVEARAAAAGARRMELHVFTGNQGAIRFYERIGYERIEARLRFYGAEGLDAFVYRKDLAAL